MLFILLALAAVVPPAPPAVIAPPVITTGRRVPPADGEDADEIAVLDVDIRAGGETLWSGPMRVSSQNAASVSRMKTDAPPADCAGRTRFGGGQRSSLQISLNQNRYNDQSARFQLHVSWEHPTSPDSCGTNDDSRSVGLTESFALDHGQSVSFQGDGGMVVRLHRR